MILRFTQLLHGLDTSADLTTQLSPSLVLSGIWWIRTRQERKSVGSRVDQFRDARKSGNYLNELNHIDDPVVLTVSQQPKSTFKGWLIFSPPYVVHETEPALVKLQIMEDTTKVLIKILSIIHEKRWKSLLHQWWHHHRWTSSVTLEEGMDTNVYVATIMARLHPTIHFFIPHLAHILPIRAIPIRHPPKTTSTYHRTNLVQIDSCYGHNFIDWHCVTTADEMILLSISRRRFDI